jgi:hypothetical protein
VICIHPDCQRVTSPIVHYGIPIAQAVVIVALAFTILEGTVRLVALGIAVATVVVAPQILKGALG